MASNGSGLSWPLLPTTCAHRRLATQRPRQPSAVAELGVVRRFLASMNFHHLTLPLLCAALAGCDLSSGRSQGTSNSQFDAQTAEYDRQLKISDQQAEEADRLLKRQMAQMDISERDAKRMDALLKKWEEQAKRYDAILTKWEGQPVPFAPK
jgi:hypothetical protein